MSRGRAASNPTSCSCSKTHTRLALLVNHLLAVKCKAKCPVKGCKHILFGENPGDILEHLLCVHKKVAEDKSETLTLLSLIINPELNAVINLPKNVADNERESGRQLLKKALSERYHLNDKLNFLVVETLELKLFKGASDENAYRMLVTMKELEINGLGKIQPLPKVFETIQAGVMPLNCGLPDLEVPAPSTKTSVVGTGMSRPNAGVKTTSSTLEAVKKAKKT
ncbi:hypothetical protein HDU79_005650 [Rhizoclosmatium sp. JEL0117]|nr:hypothetical protein HDU79_005650 [Rhizoclosmatium sp. JEL0117]